MKPIPSGWKEGIISQDLRSAGGTSHKKGDTVRYKRYLAVGDDRLVSKYQWHYININNVNLIRHSKLIIEGQHGNK